MDIVLDAKERKVTCVDTINNYVVNNDEVTKLINVGTNDFVSILCYILFYDKGLKKKEYETISYLYKYFLTHHSNEINKKEVVVIIANEFGLSERTIERYINKFITYGIISKKDNTISFTKFYDINSVKYPNTKFIIIETNPNRLINKITL